MDDKKRQAIHKQAVLEFMYATAAAAVGHTLMAMVESHGDYQSAQSVLSEPLTRDAFARGVQSELSKAPGKPPMWDATVGQVADAARAAARTVARAADDCRRGASRPPIIVVNDVEGVHSPDASPGSSSFGTN